MDWGEGGDLAVEGEGAAEVLGSGVGTVETGQEGVEALLEGENDEERGTVEEHQLR